MHPDTAHRNPPLEERSGHRAGTPCRMASASGATSIQHFLQLEFDRLWAGSGRSRRASMKSPQVNDFTTYEIGDQAVFLVRVGSDTVKAYHNVCPHRGTALAEGAGTFAGGNIICPFHGWRWDTEGDNQYVLAREEFRGGKLCDCRCGAQSCALEVFAGFVFINFDRTVCHSTSIHRAGTRVSGGSEHRRNAPLLVEIDSHSRPTGRWRRKPSSKPTMSRRPIRSWKPARQTSSTARR